MTASEEPSDRMKRVTAATLRAVAQSPKLEVAYANDSKALTATTVQLITPSRMISIAERSRLRGEADQLAVKLRYHNPALAPRSQPQSAVAKAVFDSLEQTRCEILGAQDMVGIKTNIDAALNHDYRRKGYDRMAERTDQTMAEMVRLYLREVITHQPPPESAQSLMQLWRPWLQQRLLPATIERLAEKIGNQVAFAREIRQLLVSLELETAEDALREESDDAPNQDGAAEDQENESETDEDAPPDESAAGESETSIDQSDDDAANSGEPDEEDIEEGETSDKMGSDEPPPQVNNNDPIAAGLAAYRIYTREYDEIVEATELCEEEELEKLRKLLDDQLKPLQSVVGRLANRLQRRLLARQQRSWEFDLEEGILDAARLTRVILQPSHALSYKREKETNFRDTVVSLLIDNSGSMRGRPISIAAMSTDILARTLERCAVKVEILGFTTRAWKGGQSREAWLKAGKVPQNPGRLNDLRHIIYKAADAPYRRAKMGLGLMLREGLLKENIDGEALLWAHSRLVTRPEQRRILLVISDGAPVDDSTLSVNSNNSLERHLRDVITMIERKGAVELSAIGIGHDVTRYYSRAITLTDAEQLGGALIEKVTELFDDDAVATQGGRRRQ